MTYAAIALLVVSACVHAVWNLIGKRENSSPMFFLQASATGCVCMLPIVLTHVPIVEQITPHVWLLLLVTGLFQAIYYCGLAGAYRSGHLSVAYPLARSAPVILVAAVSILIGKGYELNPKALAGMALITLGGLALPVGKLSEWKMRDYLHTSSLLALMAAIGTTGYSVIDDSALRILKGLMDVHSSHVAMTLVYAFFETLSAGLWMLLIVTACRSRNEKPQRFKEGLGSAALAGVGISFAYALVLLAMTFAKNVSYVVAFRQLSIPIGAALGITILKEPRNAMKLIGVSVMLCGLVLVALR